MVSEECTDGLHGNCLPPTDCECRCHPIRKRARASHKAAQRAARTAYPNATDPA